MKEGVSAVERERLDNGCYRVFLSDEELQEWGLSFERLSGRSPCTRALLSALLVAASEGDAFDAEGITAEVFPVEGGCFLLFSPSIARERPMQTGLMPLCAAFDTLDTLLDFCRAARTLSLRSSSLYRHDGRLWLVLYPLLESEAHARGLLSEWECFVASGQVAAAFFSEHGVPIYDDDALQRLNEAG